MESELVFSGNMSRPVPILQSVLRGGSLSISLFILYISGLLRYLKKVTWMPRYVSVTCENPTLKGDIDLNRHLPMNGSFGLAV